MATFELVHRLVTGPHGWRLLEWNLISCLKTSLSLFQRRITTEPARQHNPWTARV
jgi:hypothetical protein